MLTDKKIRDIMLTSLFSDDTLADNLTLKGAQALTLTSSLRRTTTDLDLSATFNKSKEELEPLFFRALKEGFNEAQYEIVSFKLVYQPRKHNNWYIKSPIFPHNEIIWGGYQIIFSIVSFEKFDNIRIKKERQNKKFDAAMIADRSLEIDLSFGEYTETKDEVELDDTIIYVYSPLMSLYEKARASVQQLPDYTLTSSKTRSRDIYDIYQLVNDKNLNILEHIYLPENIEILKKMFSLKGVDLELLTKVKQNYSEELIEDFEYRVKPQLEYVEQQSSNFEYMLQTVSKIFEKLYQCTNL